MKEFAFIFDENKCVACKSCIVACNLHHENNDLRKVNRSSKSDFILPNFSIACNHCSEPLCLINCPANAYTKDENSNAIIHEENKCIGCKYCSWVCPFDAPVFKENKGVMSKCDFCYDQNKEGNTYCADACPTGALKVVEKQNTETLDFFNEIVPSLSLKKRNKKTLKRDLAFVSNDANVSNKFNLNGILKELPLTIMTWGFAFVSANIFMKFTSGAKYLNDKFLFVLSSVLAVLSLFHLGKKARFINSIKNIKNSWLSREVIAISAFLVIQLVNTYFIEIPIGIIFLSAVILLATVDKIYQNVFDFRTGYLLSGSFIMAFSMLMFFNFHLILVLLFNLTRFSILIKLSKNDFTKLSVILLSSIFTLAGVIFVLNGWFLSGIILYIISEFLVRVHFYNSIGRKYFLTTLNNSKTK